MCVVALLFSVETIAFANEPTAAELEFFEKKIRPVLAAHCYKCHGPDKQEGALRLDSRVALIEGGDTGEAIVPGKPDESLLIEAILYGDDGYQMPPSGKLPQEIINNLTRWVKIGAPWPKEQAPGTVKRQEFNLQERAKHWSFQPLQKVAPPPVMDAGWASTDVDRFILAQLEQRNLKPAIPAARRLLIRRLNFALIGLPPTAEEVRAFVEDDSPEAVEKVVDRLLASPHFGERWGRHWLDLVRYAESHGHEFDHPIHHAWRYRDYVIRALNADVPYDDFVREQIAGDLLNQPRRHPTDGYNESILGTGFWWLGEANHAPVDVRGDEAGRVDNQIDVMTKTFLGATVACARCHDHKFDPISTKDYYALAGFLQSSRRQFAALDPHGTIGAHVEKLTMLSDHAEGVLPQVIPTSTEFSADSFARNLHAAVEFCRQDPRPAHEAFAAARQLKSEQFARWVKAIETLDKDAADESLQSLKSLKRNLQNPQSVVPDLAQRAKHAADNLDRTKLFTDFNGEDFGDWFATGHAFGSGPSQASQWDAASPAACPAPPGTAHSGRLAGKLQGVLRSPTFEITGDRIFYRMAGRGGTIRLIIDGYFMDEFSALLFGGMKFKVDTEGRFVWHTQNVSKYIGHRAYIELIDDGDGYVAVDEIRLGNGTLKLIDPPDPRLLERLRQEEDSTAESISRALADRMAAALTRWHRGEADAYDQRLLGWAMSHELLDGSAAKHDEFVKLDAQLRELGNGIPAPLPALAITVGSAEDERIHIRGSHKKLGETVPRRFLEVVSGADQPPIGDACGRLELAEQIVSPKNPLTARVIVNRVWHHLFGRGIVASVDNFGVLGQRPTHPELLDYLAAEFMADGWSLKRLIRRLVLTRTYQMTSHAGDPAAERADPENLWLRRMRVRRLEGEVIRDAMLAVSGRLDRKMYGNSIPVHLTAFMEGRGRPKKSGPLDGAGRRSIYIRVNRNFLSPMMLAFDTPIPFSTVGRRTRSNVPAQGLILMNDPFVKQQAELWARQLIETESDPRGRIATMYEAAFARRPSTEEIDAAIAFLETQSATHGDGVEFSNDRRVWADLCHVLFTLKEFTFVE